MILHLLFFKILFKFHIYYFLRYYTNQFFLIFTARKMKQTSRLFSKVFCEEFLTILNTVGNYDPYRTTL